MPSSTTTNHIIMKSALLIEARREGYEINQVLNTLTAGELIAFLSDYDEDTPVYLSHDGGYTFGGISYNCIKEEEIEEDSEEDTEN